MAEHGAHITSAGEADRPTIFEVLAQESLMVTVRPALKHAVRVIAENRPAQFGWLLRYYDELYACLDLLIENYHLRKYCGSFAENFYDLKRVPAEQDGGKLSSAHHWMSVLLLENAYKSPKEDVYSIDLKPLQENAYKSPKEDVYSIDLKPLQVVVPYMKTKLNQLFEDMRHKYGADRRSQSRSSAGQVTCAFLSIYPYVHMTWEGVCLWYQLTYMLGKGTWHSPFLQLSGTELRHVDQFDLYLGRQTVNLDWSNTSVSQKLVLLLKRCAGLTALTLSSGLSMGMFFLQFLDWWYASDNRATSLMALPIPDPPKIGEQARGLSPLMCPVCGRTRTNDTALSVSGYVFCYPCIHGYVKQHGCCPVTNYPATSDHLIKLYLTDT